MTCKICSNPTVDPIGKSKDVIVIWEAFTGEVYSGEPIQNQFGYTFLKNELGKFGLDLAQMRVTSLWLHSPNKDRTDAEWNFQQAMLEAMNKKFVLLLGTGATQFFLNKNATSVSGLVSKADMLGAEYVMGCLNPNNALTGCNGETVLAIKKFALLYKGKR